MRTIAILLITCCHFLSGGRGGDPRHPPPYPQQRASTHLSLSRTRRPPLAPHSLADELIQRPPTLTQTLSESFSVLHSDKKGRQVLGLRVQVVGRSQGSATGDLLAEGYVFSDDGEKGTRVEQGMKRSFCSCQVFAEQLSLPLNLIKKGFAVDFLSEAFSLIPYLTQFPVSASSH